VRTTDSGALANGPLATGLSALPAAPLNSAADPQQGASRTSEVRIIAFVPRRPHNDCFRASSLDTRALFVLAHSSCSPIL
jgi:hypothetical protein